MQEIREILHKQELNLARNNILLELHMKRTEQLEHRVEPIEKHVEFVGHSIKFILGLAALCAAVLTIRQFLE